MDCIFRRRKRTIVACNICEVYSQVDEIISWQLPGTSLAYQQVGGID